MANKPVEFKTKLFHEGKVYLKISDVARALGYSKKQDFINEHSQLIEKISGIQCIRETDYNNLLYENNMALQKQGQIEVTKIETLRSKIDSVISLQGFKLLLARDYLQMMADRTGCSSKEEYLVLHEIPKEKRKALQELVQSSDAKSSYLHMIEYLQDKERFDVNKIRNFGLDVQYLVSIDCCGKVDIDAYVVGQGVFYKLYDYDNYVFWNDMYIDENGNTILPYLNFDSNHPVEQLINISKSDIDRDFRAGNVLDNIIWCVHNLDVESLEDYEYEVFGYHKDTIEFSMSLQLLAKIIKPDAVDTIYTDKLIDLETGIHMTEFDSEKVFEEDFSH